MRKEIYVSTDIEADGPIPGPNSMLSLGSAAYSEKKKLLGTFSVNLLPLLGAAQDPKTMRWWKKNPRAWAECQRDQQDPAVAMPAYAAWLKMLPGDPVFVGYPAAYDFMFVYWYLIQFAKVSPFSYSAADIKTYSMSTLRRPYRLSGKRYMPKEWFDPLPHTHKALDDAIEQGALFCNILAARAKQP